MSTDHTYNGWTNFETWAAALYIDNEEWSYRFARNLAREHAENPSFIGEVDVTRGALADEIKDWAEITYLDPTTECAACSASLATDLLRAAWSEIDWHEIAGNWLDEIRREMPQA